MSKINKLVKQAELFERLAVFGDRASFLKSLGQQPDFRSAVSDSVIKASVANLDKGLGEWLTRKTDRIPSVPVLTGFTNSVAPWASYISSWMRNPNFDGATISNLHRAARELAAYATFRDMTDEGRTAWAQLVGAPASHLLDVAGKQVQFNKQWVANMPAPSNPDTTNQQAGSLQVPETPVVGQKPKNQLPPFPKELQDKLNRLLVPPGDIFPLDRDGVLGPQTQAALEKFKIRYNVPGNYNPKEVMEVLKNTTV